MITRLLCKLLLITSFFLASFCYTGDFDMPAKFKINIYPGTEANAQNTKDKVENNDSQIPMVDLSQIDKTLVLDLRYASDNNFTGHKIYPVTKAYLRLGTAHKLLAAHHELMDMGYKIKVYDAYRPYYVQQILYNAAGASEKHFIADPREGSYHNRGAAVDVTITDLKGNELPMPSGFDEFNFKAYRNYQASPEATNNRDILTQVMLKHGFEAINSEWWHYNDNQALKYPILDLKLEDLP